MKLCSVPRGCTDLEREGRKLSGLTANLTRVAFFLKLFHVLLDPQKKTFGDN